MCNYGNRKCHVGHGGGSGDEVALLEALKAKKIAGAPLDLVTVEPIRKENPLLALDNASSGLT